MTFRFLGAEKKPFWPTDEIYVFIRVSEGPTLKRRKKCAKRKRRAWKLDVAGSEYVHLVTRLGVRLAAA